MANLNGFREGDVRLHIEELASVIVQVIDGDVQRRERSIIIREEFQDERTTIARTDVLRTPIIAIDELR